MTQAFKVREVVKLKSGGPKMVIHKIAEANGDVKAWCEWVEKGKEQRGTFSLTSLERPD
jgi:uncharacterized protein YodC (DUF2158 family)